MASLSPDRPRAVEPQQRQPAGTVLVGAHLEAEHFAATNPPYTTPVGAASKDWIVTTGSAYLGGSDGLAHST